MNAASARKTLGRLRAPAGRVAQMLHRAAAAVTRLARRALLWPTRRRCRFLTLVWVIGITVLGAQSGAHADDLIPMPTQTPDDPAKQSMFEHYGVDDYDLFYQPDANNDGLDAAGISIMNLVENGMLSLTLYFLRGALTAIYWLLGTNFYADNHDQINAAVSNIAGAIIPPLMGLTVAVAGITTYTRSHRDGGGTAIGDLSWIIAGGIFATMFVLIPGDFLKVADGIRSEIATRLIGAYGGTDTTIESQSGYTATITGGVSPNCGTSCTSAQRDLAIRQLTNQMWEAYAVKPWCYLQFKSLDTCKRPSSQGASMGVIFLNHDDGFEKVKSDLAGQYDEVKDGGYPDFHGNDRWIRGQLPTRFGAVLLFTLMTSLLAGMLLALVLFGLMAAIGLVLLVVAGPLFMLLLMIPGAARRIGLQWFGSTMAVLGQAQIVTLVLGGVTVLSSIINSKIAVYGYFITCLLNLVALVTGWRMRAQLESHLGANLSMTSGAPLSAYSAWQIAGRVGRTGSSMTRRAGRLAKPVAGAAGRVAGMAAGQIAAKAYNALPEPMRQPSTALTQRATDRARVISAAAQQWTPQPAPSRAARAANRTQRGVEALGTRSERRELAANGAKDRIAARQKVRQRPGRDEVNDPGIGPPTPARTRPPARSAAAPR